MNRTALYYGLWAAACTAAALVAFFIAADLESPLAFRDTMFEGFGRALEPILLLLLFCIPTGIVAGLAWAIAHRIDREPGWLAYAVLAVFVVVISHILVFGTISFPTSFAEIPEALWALSFLFLLHGWVTVPVALVGTALFVLWTRRRADAVPAAEG
ncbi:MAG: hypothetical protein JSR24_10605 [Proteobacteria bacterium]|nr:hypothetical protein [Pseudomonadota bacterium]